jgi:hypothetical protein
MITLPAETAIRFFFVRLWRFEQGLKLFPLLGGKKLFDP